MRSANYLYPLRRTTFHMLQSAVRERNSHASAVDICLVLLREALQHVNSPFQLPANHLQEYFMKL